MTRSEWTEVAEALGNARRMFAAGKRPLLIKGTQIAVVDHMAMVIASVLSKRSPRFNPEKFLATIGVGQNSGL